MIRHIVLFVPRLLITATCAAIVVGAAVPLFWLRDRVDRRDADNGADP